jgi:L-alanine-DL-glutamate epimerase-like enolase superfamily enzyme
MTHDFEIVRIEIIPCRLPLHEPFVIAYARQDDIPTVLVRVTTRGGLTGWGEATPDLNVTGESYHSTIAILQHELAPALLGHDARDREMAIRTMDLRVEAIPAAKAALDIALHDLVARAHNLPLWALLGGRSKPHLQISRVVSMKAPDAMAKDALQHVADGFANVKLKVGEAQNWRLDVDRIAAVRAALGPDVKIKVDVNQGWKTAANAIPAIRAALASSPEYIEQPVDQHDIEALAEVRRQTGATIMADECCHGPREMQRIVALRAADLVNIKLMKTGGIVNALKTNAIAETAGIAAQIGTMVESSIASAAGLHLAMAMANVRTVEMGGPLMITEEVGNLRDYYEKDCITLPDKPGLGIEIDEAAVKRISEAWLTISAYPSS